MLTIFCLSQCIKEKLSCIFSDPRHSNFSLLCLAKLIFGLLLYTIKKREQEYMRGRGKGFRLHSKPIYIIKCLDRGKYWEKRIALPGGPRKVGSGVEKLKRKTLETCGIWCKKQTNKKKNPHEIKGNLTSCSESPSWFLISTRIWIVLKLLSVARLSLNKTYSDTGRGSLLYQSFINFTKSSFCEVECLAPVNMQWHFIADLTNWLFPVANYQSPARGLGPSEMQSGGNSTIPHPWHLVRYCNFPQWFDISFLFFHPHGIPTG